MATVIDSPRNWRTLKVGAGGWLTAHDQHSDGTLVCRLDTYGACLWNAATSTWSQLVTSSSMPAAEVHVDNQDGVFEIRIAPSNSQIFYMLYSGKLYRSTNRGTTWTLCTGWTHRHMGANEGFQRFMGPKLAIDPLNPDVVYIGTMDDGLFRTLDGGTTVTLRSDVPISTDASTTPNATFAPGIVGIVFDPTSAAISGRTATLWACSHGNGYYRSTDGGDTWSKPASGPTLAPMRAAFAANGTLWCIEYFVAGVISHLWRNVGGTWEEIAGASLTVLATGKAAQSVVVDPFNVDRLLICTGSGAMQETLNANAATPTWGTETVAATSTLTATDIPWFEMSGSIYKSVGDLQFHPTIQNKLMMSMGIGFLTATVAPGITSSTVIAWVSMSAGIEQLVANQIVATPATALNPSGHLLLAAWDRPVWKITNPEVYPSTYHRQEIANGQATLRHGRGIDYCAADPNFITATVTRTEFSGYSTDGGSTWNGFPAIPGPTSNYGGIICCGSTNDLLWAPPSGQRPHYTTNRGTSWNPCTFPGVLDDATVDGYGGFVLDNVNVRYTVCADRVTANKFYFYHKIKGLFVSTDSGATWTNPTPIFISAQAGVGAAKMRCPEGKAGHLWFTAGWNTQGNPVSDYDSPNGSFYRSTDGGLNWTTIPDVLEVYDFDFGKAGPGASYPTIWIFGWVNSSVGIYYSTDEAVSWVKVTTWPINSINHVKCIAASKTKFGEAYVGFAGSGFAYTQGAPLGRIRFRATTS